MFGKQKLIVTSFLLKGLFVGNKLIEILEGNIVTANCQFLTLKLLFNDLRLNLLEYDTGNAELPLCQCDEYDTMSVSFFCQRINRRALKIVLIEEELTSSLVALINCKKETNKGIC